MVAALGLTSVQAARTSQIPAQSFDQLYSTYERGDFDVVTRTVTTAADLRALQSGLDVALRTWSPHLTRLQALFLLEIGAVVTERHLPVAKESSALLERIGAVIIRRPTPIGVSPRDDAFEVMFHKAAVAVMEGERAASTTLIDHYLDAVEHRYENVHAAGSDRPALDPRVALARAVAAEQVLQDRAGTTNVGPWSDSPDAYEAQKRFDRAAKAPDALPETFVRAAFVRLRLGKAQDALALIGRVQDPHDDPVLTYWAQFFRGRILAELDRPAEADAAYRAALDAWPHAQSAAVGLTALSLFWNDPTNARRWAVAVQSATADAMDPWWLYPRADKRFWIAWRDGLRKAAR
jgi:tetratricopeptide (TPR) repeat protein